MTALIEIVRQEIDKRLPAFALDSKTRALLRRLKPVVEKNIERLCYLDYARALTVHADKAPDISTRMDEMVACASSHFSVLFAANFDEEYVASVVRFRNIEIESSLGARSRLSIAMRLLEPIALVLARKNRFSPAGMARDMEIVGRVFTLDINTTIALEQQKLSDDGAARQMRLTEGAADFQTKMRELNQAVYDSSDRFLKSADRASQMSEAAAHETAEVSSAARRTQESAAVTASATEELSMAAAEIGSTMERNRDIAVRGVADALRLSANVKSLGAGANQIGSVVGLIAAIAAQTNLLALNAAIEAARAGSAGRGFAVIASEVKALAGQTELATRDISAQITALQAIANGSILEVKSISATIREMETEMRSISELASKQSAATALIYGDAAEVSTIAEGTMTSAGIVKNAVGILHETTGQARDLAKQLRSTSVELDSDIGDFVGWLAVT